MYGFKAYIYPIFDCSALTTQTSFYGNTATSGGALHFTWSTSTIFMSRIIVQSNSASSFGGAILFEVATSDVIILYSHFEKNTARDGGAVYSSIGNYGFVIKNTSFIGNVVSHNGGAIGYSSGNGFGLYKGMYSELNLLIIKNSYFQGNLGNFGGAIYQMQGNNASFRTCSFVNNSAVYDGAAIYIGTTNYLFVTETQFTGNTAYGRGGGIMAMTENIISFKNTSFFSNKAFQSGGSIFLSKNSTLEFAGDVLFYSNEAVIGGGALFLMSCELWSILATTQLEFTKNRAQKGSAIALLDVKSSAKVFQNITFRSNNASSGGTVFWLKRPDSMYELSGLDSSSLKWTENSAVYGERYATQAVTLQIPQVFDMLVYGGNVRPGKLSRFSF